MNKTKLLAELATQVLRVIKVEASPDPVKEAAGIKTYVANVLESMDGRAQGRNLAFYVVDEGAPAEEAYYKDVVSTPVQAYKDAAAFLKALPYIRATVTERHADLGFAIARAWADNGNGTITEKSVMLYYDDLGNPAYKEIV